MRSQRRPGQTVWLVKANRAANLDKYGNAPEDLTPVGTKIDGAQYDPGTVLEHSGTDQVPVLAPATWNLPGLHLVVSDDVIVCGARRWQVIGGGQQWGTRTKVPVVETRRA